jgi:hypothetical protein
MANAPAAAASPINAVINRMVFFMGSSNTFLVGKQKIVGSARIACRTVDQ